MKELDKHVSEFLCFCKDTLKEIRMLRENYLLEQATPKELHNTLQTLKSKLANVSGRQHEAFLKIKKFEALGLEKIKSHRYANNPQFVEVETQRLKDIANKRMVAVDKAAEATKAQLRNQIASTQAELTKVAKKAMDAATIKSTAPKAISKVPQTAMKPELVKASKVVSKFGNKGKIAAGALTAAAAVGGGICI
jgi:hypothetical protein